MNFKLEIAKEICKVVKEDDVNLCFDMLETPPNPELGDYAYPCFKLAKEFKKAPPLIAQELCESFSESKYIGKVVAVGPYLNFFLNNEVYIKGIVTEVLEKGEHFGDSTLGEGKMIVLDYSSPNIAKTFHIGHIRSTGIGNALKNVYKKLGYDTFGINYLGDWGTQFGKLIVAYKKWGDKEKTERDGVIELTRIYVKFHDEAEKDDSLNDEARSWLVKMQDGDEEALALWGWFKEISLREFNRIYDRLGVSFDSFDGESFFNDKMKPVVEEIDRKGLLKESQGAKIVDLEEFNLPPCLILRSDGGTLYPTRDISAALYRKKTYNFHKAVYVTAVDQKVHFEQWFKVIELMGYEWASELTHVPFGLVSLENGKLSTRKGNVVSMEELLDEAIQKTLTIIEDKNPNLEGKEQVARDVGIGAIIFNDLYNSRIKDVLFSWERILNFDGETGPYVQYTHARACSVLEKANYVKKSDVDFSLVTDSSTLALVKLFDTFEEKLENVAKKDEPYLLTRHLVDISKAFNKFYHNNIILTDDENLKQARLAIVECTRNVLEIGLNLLGINAPKKM
ncbi:MAG: arginine--tRNA ligase [Lachnospirales bacterium]